MIEATTGKGRHIHRLAHPADPVAILVMPGSAWRRCTSTTCAWRGLRATATDMKADEPTLTPFHPGRARQALRDRKGQLSRLKDVAVTRDGAGVEAKFED